MRNSEIADLFDLLGSLSELDGAVKVVMMWWYGGGGDGYGWDWLSIYPSCKRNSDNPFTLDESC